MRQPCRHLARGLGGTPAAPPGLLATGGHGRPRSYMMVAMVLVVETGVILLFFLLICISYIFCNECVLME